MPTSAVQDREKTIYHEIGRALLGLILIEGGSPALPWEALTTLQLPSPRHQAILETMLEMHARQKPLELYTLTLEMNAQRNLEKAGGAEILAGLTNGVPLGVTASILPEYLKILQSAQQTKTVQQESYELSQSIQTGAGLEEIAEQAQKLADHAQAKAPAKRLAAVRFPPAPEEAWHGMAKIYRAAMEKTSFASDNFHLASFLTVAGAMLGKSVAIGSDQDAYIYPNLFMLLVGDSGECKDQAAKRALGWMRRTAPAVFIVNHVASPESWIDELSEAKKKREEQADHSPLRSLLYLSELRDLIEKSKQKGQGTIVSRFTQAYDVPAELNARTRGQPTGRVSNVVTSILASSNPDWMKDIDMKDLRGGLGSRVMFCPGESKPADRRWLPPEAACLAMLVDSMHSVQLAYPLTETRKFQFTEESETLLDRWFAHHKSLLSDDPLIKFLAVRDIVHVYKISLIHAALDRRPEIEAYHVRAAIAFVDFLRDVRPAAFEGHGFSPTQIAQAAAERIIKERARISYSDALRLFSRRYGDSMLFKRIIDSLGLVGGPVEVQITQGARPKRFLVWRGGN